MVGKDYRKMISDVVSTGAASDATTNVAWSDVGYEEKLGQEPC
jgi:hypothetical protein